MSRDVRRSHDAAFREGAVRSALESSRSIAAGVRDRGLNGGTLGNWVARATAEGTAGLSRSDAVELKRFRAENAELRMERDVLERSVVLPVLEATR